MVALYNDSSSIQHIDAGDRIAQLIFHHGYRPVNGFEEVEELSDTSRSSGGFGSTGTN
jgi:dUTPase